MAKIYKLACLEDDVNVSDTLSEVRDMIALINNAHIADDYPVWRGIDGPKWMHNDIPEQFTSADLVNLAPHKADGFVLALKTVD
jgi:Asp-tRNA(Asn)/Glu-tRNA(Gln) amidotransferase C subunit